MEIAIRKETNIALKILDHPNYDITAIDDMGRTILHLVAQNFDRGAELTKLLLDAGADALVNVPMHGGGAALHNACSTGNIPVIGELLKVPGIKLSIRNDIGETPLMSAIEAEHSIVCDFLLDNYVSCNEPAQTLSVASPLRTAISVGSNIMVARLLKEDAATTFQVPLKLVLQCQGKADMETTIFESENLATHAINICANSSDFEFEDLITIVDKVVVACPLAPHDETVFQLYMRHFKQEKRGLAEIRFQYLTVTPKKSKQLFRVIHKSVGLSVDENHFKYLIAKYQLSVEDDSKLLVPFTIKPLRLLSVFKSREWIVEYTRTRNIVRALDVWREQTGGFEYLLCDLDLEWFADYSQTNMAI